MANWTYKPSNKPSRKQVVLSLTIACYLTLLGLAASYALDRTKDKPCLHGESSIFGRVVHGKFQAARPVHRTGC